MSVKDFRTRKEIVISIDRGGEAEQDRRRGGLLPNGVARPTNRRRFDQDDGKICLRVFDGGQFADGSDVPVRHDETIAATERPSPSGGVQMRFEYGNTNFTQTVNDYFAGLSGFESEFMEVTEPAKYGDGAAFLSGKEYIDGRGFNTGGAFPTVPGVNAAWQFLDRSDYTKITAEPSYSAPAVAFEQDRDGDLFLVPRMFRAAGESHEPRRDTNKFFHYAANAFYEPLPRSFGLENADWESFTGAKMFASCYNNMKRIGQTRPANPDAPAALKQAWKLLHQTRPGARLYKLETTKAINPIIDFSGFVDPSELDTEILYNGSFTDGLLNSFTLHYPHYSYSDAQQASYHISPGLLIGAVRLDDPEQWFYFWRKSQTVLWAGSCRTPSYHGGSIFAHRYWLRVDDVVTNLF